LKIASVAEVKAQFSAYLKSEQGLVIFKRNGKAVAALLAVRDDEELERLVLAHSPRLQAILDTSRQQIREGEGVGHEDCWAEMDEEKPRQGRGKGKKTAA
jgi:PHD/YefM family antitoxin component YafN of YafNO toxin-antitoxin module